MLQDDDLEYCRKRAALERKLECEATDPGVGAIHAELAVRYEKLAVQFERGERPQLQIVLPDR